MINPPVSRMLVPLDLSKPSLAALEIAKTLARRWGAALDLLYVQNLPLSLMGFGAEGECLGMPALWQQMKEFRQWREGQLRQAARGLPKRSTQVRTACGWPPDEILKFARARKSGLIVMGTHGHTGADRVLFGSTAEAVVRRADVPVLTVHPEAARGGFSRVLVPCNMTPYADQALRYALDFTRNRGARVAALYVASGELGAERKAFAEHLREVAGKDQARITPLVRQGSPRHAILEETRRGGFDLIILSTHRKRLWKRLMLGSTAENVLRHASVPVLSVPSCSAGRPNATKEIGYEQENRNGRRRATSLNGRLHPRLAALR